MCLLSSHSLWTGVNWKLASKSSCTLNFTIFYTLLKFLNYDVFVSLPGRALRRITFSVYFKFTTTDYMLKINDILFNAYRSLHNILNFRRVEFGKFEIKTFRRSALLNGPYQLLLYINYQLYQPYQLYIPFYRVVPILASFSFDPTWRFLTKSKDKC